MSNTDGCTLVVAEMFELVNKQRKQLKLPPVENGAIASRCTLRFNIDRQQTIDFSQEKVVLGTEDILALEKLINEQFNCYMQGDLQRICAKPKKPAGQRQRTALPSEFTSSAPAEPIESEEKGLISKIKRIFGN